MHTDRANYDGNHDYNGYGAKTGVYHRRTIPIGSLSANVFGLHEIAGNVYDVGGRFVGMTTTQVH